MTQDVVIITGVNGLVGSAAARLFGDLGFEVVGIDNNLRSNFFGADADSSIRVRDFAANFGSFTNFETDIRDIESVNSIFSYYGRRALAIIHCAAQPSHDWAAREPMTDFTINANGTLNLLEAFRKHASEASFVFMSTNKVYGDKPNEFEYEEQSERWSPSDQTLAERGFGETLGLDMTTHSLFGVSKSAADLMVQEYGRYFGLRTTVLRGGCLTGPLHAGTELHGFLSYLVKCAVKGHTYTVFGYKGKQVRDNIHSEDLAKAILCCVDDPSPGEVYNIGGGVENTVSIIEAIAIIESINSKYRLDYELNEKHRVGDHIWYATDLNKFQTRYPNWRPLIGVKEIIEQIIKFEEEFSKHED